MALPTEAIDLAINAADQFVKIYYDAFDKTRHILDKLYTDAATYIWNGNVCSGQEAIMKFIGTLPISEHVLETVDSQPLATSVSGGETSILVTTSGTVRYKAYKMKTFSQTFILVAQNNKNWKILSDVIRTTE